MTNQSELREEFIRYICSRDISLNIPTVRDRLEALIDDEVVKALEEVRGRWPTGYMKTETEHFYDILDAAISARKEDGENTLGN